MQNLLGKRSRFAPSTHSLLAVCPVPWLLAPVDAADQTPRWKATGVLRHEPALPVVLPVRDIRVLYALKRAHYAGFARHQVLHAHEFFVPMDSITAEGSDSNPALRSLIARATAQTSSASRRRRDAIAGSPARCGRLSGLGAAACECRQLCLARSGSRN